MSWSPQQDRALCAIRDWYVGSDDQVFYLAGYAGTGKTTLAKEAAGNIASGVLFGAFTGKAALVLRKKGCGEASTIHSMIYRRREVLEKGPDGRWTTEIRYDLNPLSEVQTAGLVVIDECSMVDGRLGRDLLSFGTKVLVLGDPAQLPPVQGEGYFTANDPDFMLTDIHRQAADNPIIRMSMTVREGGRLAKGRYGESRVVAHKDLPGNELRCADQVLCGKNDSRRALNKLVRRDLGRDAEYPEVGDKLVCLKNDREKGLLNGSLWRVETILGFDEDGARLELESLDDYDAPTVKVYVRKEFFQGREAAADPRGTDQFTYGYALTVHKSQGSQWDHVVIFDESFVFRKDRHRHLYTALTRAAESVTVVQA